MKKFLGFLVVVLIVAAYVGGYWPEHQHRLAAESEVSALQAQLDDAQVRVRLGGLLARLLSAMDAVAEKNYGQAQALSSAFFDQVREEEARAPRTLKDALGAILKRRDAVTAALTQADPAVLTVLRQNLTELRSALGYPPPSAPSGAPAPSPAPASAAGASPSASPGP
jgi:hypothetical protein